jgi:hypothetical protein
MGSVGLRWAGTPIEAHQGLLDLNRFAGGLPVARLLWTAALARAGTLPAATARSKHKGAWVGSGQS